MEQAPDANPNGDKSNKPSVAAESSSSDNARPPHQQKKAAKYYQRAKRLIWWLIGRPIVWTAKALDPYSVLLTALATIALAILTYFLAVYANDLGQISGKQLDAMREQQRVMQGQLDEMQIDQRPWISITSEIRRNGVVRYEWNGQQGISTSETFTLRNYGHSPARNVTIKLDIIPRPNNFNTNLAELARLQERLCADAERTARNNKIAGVTVFPGKDERVELGIGMGTGKRNTPFNAPFGFTIQGCADYTFSNNRHGKAALRFIIGRVVNYRWAEIPFEREHAIQDVQDPSLYEYVLKLGQFDYRQDLAGGNYVQ
jgi:hypothetical protein